MGLREEAASGVVVCGVECTWTVGVIGSGHETVSGIVMALAIVVEINSATFKWD